MNLFQICNICRSKCTARASTLTNPTATLFGERVGRVLRNVTSTAVAQKGYAAAGEDDNSGGNLGAYALAQCWSTVTQSGCKDCLDNAVSKIKGCVPGTDGRAMNAGCFLRYSTQKFYNVPMRGGKRQVSPSNSQFKLSEQLNLDVHIDLCQQYLSLIGI